MIKFPVINQDTSLLLSEPTAITIYPRGILDLGLIA